MGSGKVYLLFWLMQTLLPPATATASTRFTGLPFLFSFYLYFYSSFSYSFFFSFFFSFFIFLFLFFFFSLSFFFFLSIFYFFISSPSFPLLFLVTLLEGARKGIIRGKE